MRIELNSTLQMLNEAVRFERTVNTGQKSFAAVTGIGGAKSLITN
jgi:hypothetical protein